MTLKLDSASFEKLNGLRRAHFPPERNHLSAHLTLFHALPPDKEAFIREVLEEVTVIAPKPRLEFSQPRFLGKGVAIEVEAPAVVALRRQLSNRFREFLTPQDAQNIRPHVTVQNKVTPEAARQLFEQLHRDWQPWNGLGEGLQLWRYLGGPWESAGEYEFKGTG